MSETSGPLKRTPFYDIHVAAGAKMVSFAGFEMPIQYPGGITAEHNAVRNGCGVFDVSHMGEFLITGPQAIDFVTYVTSNDVAALAVGQVHYSAILTEQGTFVDDCLVYRYADFLMMVVNGSNKDKDFAHISKYLAKFDCKLKDVSDDIGLLAVQGPQAQEIIQKLTPHRLDDIKYYWFTETTVAGIPMTLSRTGYTGEDGFELYHDAKHSAKLWQALMET
ncbi:MAG: glycine cleavage system aminomethyltransferase GcvT, partial [Gemmatimonadaceae bacterium]|nr:glycine cleavage system aminomethyltransferase GcvT [Gemmatimonadaceae bacterium]